MRYLTIVAFSLGLLVVVLGAYTRLVDAGLGCPDWPGCYGFVGVPTSEAELAIANERFPDHPVESEKAWPEMIHRYAATLLGIVILAILAVAIFARLPLGLPITLTLLVIAQGIFGAWTVTLKLWPQVVTLHLLGGFATVTLLWLYFVQQGGVPRAKVSHKARTLSWLVGALLVAQITLGGWTASNYAALACPDFPLCHGQLIPAMDFRHGFNVLQEIGPSYLGGELSNDARIAIQVSHRLGAMVLAGFTLLLLTRLPSSLRWWLGSVLVIQFGLGVSNIWLQLPLAVATLHNLVALVYLLTIAYVLIGPSTRSSAG